MATPDLTQKVIGFRQWKIEGTLLYPVSTGKDPWLPGPQRAVCAHMKHTGKGVFHDPCIPPVQPYCECGFYALHKLSEAQWYGDKIRGIVLGWGRMAVHNEGWRSQFVEIAALIYPQGASKKEKQEVDSLAKTYNVPTVPWDNAEDYAKEFGDYIPESLKPRNWTEDERDRDCDREKAWNSARAAADRQVFAAINAGLTEDARAIIKANKMVEDALEILDPEVPEAYAALHNIYVPNTGELLQGLNEGIEVEYLPKPEPPEAAEIKVDRHFEISISTNATVLWLPLQAPVRHK